MSTAKNWLYPYVWTVQGSLRGVARSFWTFLSFLRFRCGVRAFFLCSLPLYQSVYLPHPSYSGNPPTSGGGEIGGCETGSGSGLSFWRQRLVLSPLSLFCFFLSSSVGSVSFSSSIFFYPLFFSFYSLFFPLLFPFYSLTVSYSTFPSYCLLLFWALAMAATLIFLLCSRLLFSVYPLLFTLFFPSIYC